MAERLSHSPESHSSKEVFEASAENHRPEHESHQTQSKEISKETVESIRHTVEKEAKKSHDVRVDSAEKNVSTPLINRELKQMMLQRTLTSVRKRLSPAQRSFSKVVHAKPVEKVSAVSEKTIARPYAILVGGIVAFLGSVYAFWLAKRYGFRYNLLLFAILFLAGYTLAIIVEIIVYAVKRLRS